MQRQDAHPTWAASELPNRFLLSPLRFGEPALQALKERWSIDALVVEPSTAHVLPMVHTCLAIRPASDGVGYTRRANRHTAGTRLIRRCVGRDRCALARTRPRAQDAG